MSDEPTAQGAQQPPLFLVRGSASAQEIAALVAVLQAMARRHARHAHKPPVNAWSAYRRKVRATSRAGPGGWRSSGLPR